MAQPFVGEIRLFAGMRIPSGWAKCTGALLQIADYQALYSLIGTRYGGDGRVTFGLPNFTGRVPIGMGQGPNLSQRTLGQIGGADAVSLTVPEMAAHNHSFVASTADAVSPNPYGQLLAKAVPNGSVTGLYAPTNATGAQQATMDDNFLDFAGGAASGGSSQTAGSPHYNLMPYLAINYIIALKGEYPTRSS